MTGKTRQRLWEWLLPGLISLDAMGAMAYYTGTVSAPLRDDPARAARRERVSDLVVSAAVVPMARS